MPESCLSETRNGVLLAVRVTPQASKVGITGVRHGRLQVRVTAAASDGAANAAVIKLLAKKLALTPSSIEITHGESNRDKTLSLAELSLDDAAARVSALDPK